MYKSQIIVALSTTDMVGEGSSAGPGQHYTRGAACMKKYGYRLKKQ